MNDLIKSVKSHLNYSWITPGLHDTTKISATAFDNSTI
jgi:hypothetical protein